MTCTESTPDAKVVMVSLHKSCGEYQLECVKILSLPKTSPESCTISSRGYDEEKPRKPEQTGDQGITTLPREPGLRVVPHSPQEQLSERNTQARVKIVAREEKRDAPVTCLRVTFLAGGDFYARSRISHALLPLRKMNHYSKSTVSLLTVQANGIHFFIIYSENTPCKLQKGGLATNRTLGEKTSEQKEKVYSIVPRVLSYLSLWVGERT